MPVRIVRYERGIREIEGEVGKFLDKVAFELGRNSEPPVDTGFLQASFYVKSERENTFDQTWSTGTYDSAKQGRAVERERADGPVMEIGPNEAIAGWAATYAAEVEERWDAFIYRTLYDTINSLG